MCNYVKHLYRNISDWATPFIITPVSLWIRLQLPLMIDEPMLHNMLGMDIFHVDTLFPFWWQEIILGQTDKANICYPTTNIGCPQSPVNRTSAGYVETHSTPPISKWCSIILGVWSHLNYNDTLTSVWNVAACSISRHCTFTWRHQPYPSHKSRS